MKVYVTNAMSMHMLVLTSNRDAASERELDVSMVVDVAVEIDTKQ